MFWVEGPCHCYFDVSSLVQAAFKVCVGVRSGPKGPVIDISICGVALGPFARHSATLEEIPCVLFPYEVASKRGSGLR